MVERKRRIRRENEEAGDRFIFIFGLFEGTRGRLGRALAPSIGFDRFC